MQITYTLDELEQVAKKIIEKSTSNVLIFNAEMGMGKTTLIKAIVKALGSTDSVSSPTFALVNEYYLKDSIIYHFDLYRIENEDELYDFGIDDYLNKNAWLLIEWPEKIIPLLADDYSTITITSIKQDERMLTLL